MIERATKLLGSARPIGWPEVRAALERVEIREQSIHLLFASDSLLDPHERSSAAIRRLQDRLPIGDQLAIDDDALVRMVCDRRPVFRGGRIWKREGEGDALDGIVAPDPVLATTLKAAHAMLERHSASPLDPDRHEDALAPVSQRDRRLMSQGMLAPDIQKAILTGRAPAGLTAKKLLGMDVPIAWADQRKLLGFAG